MRKVYVLMEYWTDLTTNRESSYLIGVFSSLDKVQWYMSSYVYNQYLSSCKLELITPRIIKCASSVDYVKLAALPCVPDPDAEITRVF